jgi:hypothetical protein
MKTMSPDGKKSRIWDYGMMMTRDQIDLLVVLIDLHLQDTVLKPEGSRSCLGSLGPLFLYAVLGS